MIQAQGTAEGGALRELTLRTLPELQEMPDLIGLTALGSLTIEYCNKLKTMPGLGKLGALKQLTLVRLDGMHKWPDFFGLTACIEALTSMHALCLDVWMYYESAHSRRFHARCRACSSCKSFASNLPTSILEKTFMWLYRNGTCLS
jgi:hypothetical protein